MNKTLERTDFASVQKYFQLQQLTESLKQILNVEGEKRLSFLVYFLRKPYKI